MRRAHGDDVPVIVCGDFNAFPDSEELRSFCADGTAGPSTGLLSGGGMLVGCADATGGTFHGFTGVPDSAPIDYVLTGPEVTVHRRFVDDRTYRSTWPSDHFPVVADIRVPSK